MIDFGAFKFLTGDCDFAAYGGKWCKALGQRRYHVVELMNSKEVAGSDCADEWGTYLVDLSEVDLNVIDCSDALRSCGYEMQADGTIVAEHDGSVIASKDEADLVLVECCHSYGNKAPLHDASGNNHRKMIRAAIAESTRLQRDSSAHTDAMESAVNRAGTSAFNFMIGHYGIQRANVIG